MKEDKWINAWVPSGHDKLNPKCLLISRIVIAFGSLYSLFHVHSFLVFSRRPSQCVGQPFFVPFISLPSIHRNAYKFSYCSHCFFGFIWCCCYFRRMESTWSFERTVSEPSTDNRTTGGSRPPNRHLQLWYPMRQWRLLQQEKSLWILQRLLWRWLSTQL